MLQDKHNKYHIRGCIHMHTTDSDGRATHEELAGYAAEAELDYVLVTDHMTLKSKAAQERFHGTVAMIIGYEHNDPADKHHFLVFESPQVYDSSLSAKDYVAASAKDNALGIIAHPDEVRSETGEYPPYQWIDWSVEGFSGIEIWNHMSEWMERLSAASFLGKVALLFSPRKFFDKPPSATLKRWDLLNSDCQNRAKSILGIAGPDAHAFSYRLGPKELTIFPYKVHFLTLQTHLILDQPYSDDYQTARAQILKALRDCRAYFSNQRWGDAAGFTFSAHSSDGALIALPGDSIPQANITNFQISAPSEGEIRLLRNGELVGSSQGREAEFEISSPGAYRAEIWKSSKGWVYSNHIRLQASQNS